MLLQERPFRKLHARMDSKIILKLIFGHDMLRCNRTIMDHLQIHVNMVMNLGVTRRTWILHHLNDYQRLVKFVNPSSNAMTWKLSIKNKSEYRSQCYGCAMFSVAHRTLLSGHFSTNTLCAISNFSLSSLPCLTSCLILTSSSRCASPRGSSRLCHHLFIYTPHFPRARHFQVV